MAYAALVSLAQTTYLILNHHQDSISPQVKNQIIYIDEYVIFLQAFIEYFPDKAKSLEGRIRKLTHVAEDIIELMWEQIHKSSVGQSKSNFKHQPKCNYFHELKRVTKEIESIAEEVMKIKNSITVKIVQLGDSTAPTSSSIIATVHKDAMVGCDDDLMEIKSRLCEQSSKLQVVPIVGMGGIGKTTLAQNVYDDPLIMEHFQIRAWVTVSQDYSLEEIVSRLLVSMKLPSAKNVSIEEHKVYKHLKGRTYLIVLDDIWSIKAWDDLKRMFPDDGNGSRIMLTTRLSDVASYPDSYTPVHEMRLMEEDQSWNLFRQKVFKQDPCPVELEYVGKKIARSCRGLPLAIVVISGLLSVDQTKVAWENIARDVNSAISATDEQFNKILSLSYTHLPHHLRLCFLYMGIFPEDHKIRVSRLIKLWVAEGFLKPNESKSFEETGEEYLEDLVRRSLVLVTERKSNCRIKSLSMHDLMREMSIRIAQEENFSLYVHKFLRKGIKIPHRVRVTCSGLDILENIYGSTIHTLIHLEQKQRGTGCSLGYFRLLEILDLSNAYEFFFYSYDDFNPSLPAQVFELFHLRYLAFDYPFPIPAAISNLQNLQTLIICSSTLNEHFAYEQTFVSLPPEIWKMPQLRHLVGRFHLLPFEEGAMFALENLQTFSTAKNFIFSEKVLKMIPNLKKLGIYYRENDEEKGDEDYQLHNLIFLQRLENLKLMISGDFPFRDRVNPTFPGTLKKLTLSGLGLPWKDMKIVGSLPCLEVLKLRDYACVGDTWETTEGDFSELKFLLIHKSYLQHWITESSHLPRLKCLVLRRCSYLRKIPDDIGEIPTLELIKVDGSSGSLVDSAKQIRDDQQSNGNYAFQVHLVYL